MGYSCQCRGSSIFSLRQNQSAVDQKMSVKVRVVYWYCEGLNLNIENTRLQRGELCRRELFLWAVTHDH